MARVSTKENKNIYQITREGLKLSREAASELLESIPPERIEKIGEVGVVLLRDALDLLEGLQMEGAGLCAERRAAKVCQRGGPVQIDLLPASAAGQHSAQQREKYDSCKNSAIHDGFLL